MKIIGFLRQITALVLDIDDTIYPRDKDYLAEGTHGEITGVAEILGVTFEEAVTRLKEARRVLAGDKPNNQTTNRRKN